MDKIKILIALLILAGTSSCRNNNTVPNINLKKQWYKGNLHTHSYWSDGDEFPEVILDWYKTQGYQFVSLSDHNTLAEGEKWKAIPADSVYQNAFNAYLDTYGLDWVTYKIDSGQTYVKLKTYQEYRDLTEEKDKFLVIQAEEITDKYEDKHLHMNATNIQERIDPQGGNSVSEVLQNNLDQVIDQSKRTGVPILPHINHPNFFYSISLEDMYSLEGERFFEVYNGHPMVHNMGDSTHISTEEMWDLINISYIEKKKPIMYGLATDDSHHYHKKGKKWSNAGRGWVMVQADTLSAASLINAMEEGKFYASTGITLNTLKFENNILSVQVAGEPGISYSIDFIGLKKGNSNTSILKSVSGINANFELTNDIVFVRCKITSSKLHDNPIENIAHEMAWTQPLLRIQE